MMHSMFPIIPLATDPGDLRPVESLALTTPLVVAIVACLLLAVGLIALIIMLSRPARKPRNSDRARGAHSNASSKAEWRARIDDVVARHESGALPRHEAFVELSVIARDFAGAASGKELSSITLTDLAYLNRTPANRQGFCYTSNTWVCKSMQQSSRPDDQRAAGRRVGGESGGKVAFMMLAWHWPWAALAGVLATLAIIVLIVVFARRNAADDTPVFSMDDDLNTEHASRLFRQWRALGRLAISVLVLALALAIVLVARPSQVDAGDERASSRDIVLCLDVSGSTLPYDREVIDTYLELVKHFKGERIGLSIFNSTSRTVFPLTDDYELVTKQLTSASKALKGVESQDDIDKMSDAEYQDIANWLEGTQNRKDATSLIGDGVVSCAAMLPGFAYGEANHANADRQRAASIVLATDNVVSGKPTYSLTEALDLTQQTKITVDGLYSGPKASESDQTTTDMKSAIESHGGIFLTQSNGTSIDELVRDIQSRRDTDVENKAKSSMVDAPGLWTLALAVILIIWIVCAWRLRR